MNCRILTAICGFVCTACGAATADYTRVPVLFVHGSGVNGSVWTKMIRSFEVQGYPREYLSAVNLVPHVGDNRVAAETVLQPAVELLLKRAASAAASSGIRHPEVHRVNIVSHSMGAASSRWYTAKIRPDRVRVWLGISGSNYGTNALCSMGGTGNQQMCPAFAMDENLNPFQTQLNGTPQKSTDPTPYGVGADPAGLISIPPDGEREIVYLTIRIEPDRWILPPESAMLPGSGSNNPHSSSPDATETSPGNYLFLHNSSHDELLQDKRLIKFVLSMLDAVEE